MREAKLEKKLQERIKKEGGLCIKLQANFLNGIPDRLCLLPFGEIFFVEVKAPGEKPRKLQNVRIKELQSIGATVYVLDNEEQIETIIKNHG